VGVVDVGVRLGVTIDDGFDVVVELRMHLALHLHHLLTSPNHNYWNLDLNNPNALHMHIDPPALLLLLLCLLPLFAINVGLADDAVAAFNFADH
jgi:hypothetical protein